MSRLYIVTLIINLYAEYIMQNAGLDEAQAGIKIAGRNINTSPSASQLEVLTRGTLKNLQTGSKDPKLSCFLFAAKRLQPPIASLRRQNPNSF